MLFALGQDRQAGLTRQTPGEAVRKSAGCVSCHINTEPMHTAETVQLGCTDCHGGNATSKDKNVAHVRPSDREVFRSSANPVRAYTAWLRESESYVRFVNPGDLRVLDQTCGTSACHESIARNARKSMMTHGGMLWGAALYNNGAYPLKDTHFGESYSRDGTPQRIQTVPAPTADQLNRGVLPYLNPLLEWAISRPGNILRVFEQGGARTPELGIPDPIDEPGRPDRYLSVRGLGTGLRTDPVFLGLQKTRLLDPLLHLPGTNDHPGDFRGSGCTACHVIYANDRSPDHSGPYAIYGNLGRTANPDPAIPRQESGHPIRHQLTRAIPSSQCMVCHMHPGTNMVASYFGMTWWDNESEGDLMYPPKEKQLSAKQLDLVQRSNPEGSAPRGRWSEDNFLANLTDLNPQLRHTQFADFYSHGWVFRGVYKRDRKGNLLDKDDALVSFDDPEKFKKAVHLKDIHLEKGMQCIDCHFEQDVHGNGKLYNEPRAAVEIDCADCHGTIRARTNLRTSGFAAPTGGTDLSSLRTPWGKRRFENRTGTVIQRSMVYEDREWEVVQVRDTVTPGTPHFNPKSQRAKTIQRDGETYGGAVDAASLAHSDSRLTCYACHSSWMTSCFGCHLSTSANNKMPALHNEGDSSKFWTSYNYQVLRDDVYMLGIDGTVTGNRIAPARSSSAVVVSSQNANREWLYQAQQTVSSEGFSGQAFSTHVPHTVRARETKTCTDCHVSATGDNNAVMAQLLMLGTNFVNFMGRYVYVGEKERGFEAVTVTEAGEPQAVLGSYLHRVAYPSRFEKHRAGGQILREGYGHSGREVRSLQLRGEYLYAAGGPDGLEVFDVARVGNKGFSQRIVTAPVSRLGQRLFVRTKDATAVALPSTQAVDPTRSRRQENNEQKVAPLYANVYVTDRLEGLVVVNVATLLDGNPTNNFLERAVTFNPEGILNEASNITIAGNFAYIACARGVAIVDLVDPLKPRVVAIAGEPFINKPKAVAVQFRYAFVVDADGIKVLDITIPENARPVESGVFRMADVRDIYVARTYAYLAAGKRGLVVLDIEKPAEPRLALTYNAGGQMNDAYSVRLAMTNASLFAYVADGVNGLKVLQLTSPDRTPGMFGYSPLPAPELIASFPSRGPAIALSKALDRDRAVDESGNQISVFGRRGARPFNLEEMRRLFLRNGKVYTVTDPL